MDDLTESERQLRAAQTVQFMGSRAWTDACAHVESRALQELKRVTSTEQVLAVKAKLAAFEDLKRELRAFLGDAIIDSDE